MDLHTFEILPWMSSYLLWLVFSPRIGEKRGLEDTVPASIGTMDHRWS